MIDLIFIFLSRIMYWMKLNKNFEFCIDFGRFILFLKTVYLMKHHILPSTWNIHWKTKWCIWMQRKRIRWKLYFTIFAEAITGSQRLIITWTNLSVIPPSMKKILQFLLVRWRSSYNSRYFFIGGSQS